MAKGLTCLMEKGKSNLSKVIITWIKENPSTFSNLCIAFCTAVLVASTVCYTSRLVNLSIKQFQIKSYPVFSTVIRSLTPQNENLQQNILIQNKGEITAFKVNVLFVNVYQKTSKAREFYECLDAHYMSLGEKVSLIDHQIKLLPGEVLAIKTHSPLTGKYEIKRPILALCFIKFHVPYSDTYEFDVSGFMYKRATENGETSYLPQMLYEEEKSKIIKVYKKDLDDHRNEKDIKVRAFFSTRYEDSFK